MERKSGILDAHHPPCRRTTASAPSARRPTSSRTSSAAAGQKATGSSCPSAPRATATRPIASFSTFAGNPYFIDLDLLIEDGLLKKAEVEAVDWGSDPMNVDYGKIYYNRFDILRLACSRGWDRDCRGDNHASGSRTPAGCRTTPSSWRSSGISACVSWTLVAGRGRAAAESRERLEHYRTLLDADVRLFDLDTVPRSTSSGISCGTTSTPWA